MKKETEPFFIAALSFEFNFFGRGIGFSGAFALAFHDIVDGFGRSVWSRLRILRSGGFFFAGLRIGRLALLRICRSGFSAACLVFPAYFGKAYDVNAEKAEYE